MAPQILSLESSFLQPSLNESLKPVLLISDASAPVMTPNCDGS